MLPALEAVIAIFLANGDWRAEFAANADCVLKDPNAVKVLGILSQSQTVTTLANVTGDLTFLAEANHALTVGASTNGNTAGGNLSIAAGAGIGSGAGGAYSTAAGAAAGTGAGGAWSGLSGVGGNASGAGTGGAGGAWTGGSAAGGTTATGTGGAGGAVTNSAGAGGAASGAGTGGAGGAWVGRAGIGGASTSATGGASGAWTGGTQAGGAGAGTSNGGAAGLVSLIAGAGGAKSGVGAGSGGAGGSVFEQAGVGGATATTGAGTGGAGGAMSRSAGNGGAASAGTANGGAGGNIFDTPGTGGTSAGGTAGVNGQIFQRGTVCRKMTVTALTTSATLTAAQILGGMFTANQGAGAAATYTLPTGTIFQAALPASDLVAGDSWEFTLTNISTVAAEDATLAGATGMVAKGNLTVASNDAVGSIASGRFRIVYESSNTYSFYRI